MQITNRTQTVYTWIIWDPSDSIYWGAKACEWIHPGQTHTVDVPSAGFKLYYLTGKYPAIQLNKFGPDSKFISNPDAQILIQGGFPSGFVDWDPVRKQYIDGKVPSKSSAMSLTQGAGVATASIKAAAEVMKFIPLFGTVVSGLLNITANIVDGIAKGAGGSSSQLDPVAFLAAVREVVRSENDRQTAETAASTFINAAAYLASLDPTDLGPHSLEDLKQNTEDFCAPGRDPLNHLTSINRDHNKAKHITSAYLLGISAYLQFLWFHFLIAVNEGDAISANKLKGVRDSIAPCATGVAKLRAEALSSVNQTVTSTRVTVEPEVSQLRQAAYTAYLGLPDLTALDTAIQNLAGVLQALEADLQLATNGQRIKYYFKATWGLQAPGAQPVIVVGPPTPPVPSPVPVPKPAPGRPWGPGADS